MKRGVIVGFVVGVALAAASGGLAARHYLITSSHQIKPGAIGYRNLDRFTQRLITRGRRGKRGREGDSGANTLAAASGLVGWTSDPALISTSKADSSGSIHGGAVWLERGKTVHWLAELLTADGSGVVHGAFAIYDSRLHLVAATADSPKAFETARAGTWVRLPLARPFRVRATGLYYLVDLFAGSATPAVGVVEATSGVLSGRNVLPTGVARNVRGGSGLSAFPSTLTNTGTDETRCILAG